MTRVRLAYAGAEVETEFDSSSVWGYLAGRVTYLKVMLSRPASSGSDPGGSVAVSTLRERLRRAPVLKKAEQLTVEGTFFPGVLMYAGWWERQRGAKVQPPKWHDDLQAWLFSGFEQWGPSWNFSPLEEADAWILGQIGEGDEANSLPVIVPPEKADAIREELMSRRRVFQVLVSGSLCHRHHLEGKYRKRADRWGEAFDYFIKLDADNHAHRIDPLSEPPEMYSGYLWQCLAPKKWGKAPRGHGLERYYLVNPPRLEKVYFLWEHTDFTKPDAIAYNLDSLQRKKEYLERQYGALVLLQKSADLVPGEQVLPWEIFYRYVTEASVDAD